MKIRTKSGEVIDLVKHRRYAEEALRAAPGGTSPEHPGHAVLAVYDALEAALSVPKELARRVPAYDAELQERLQSEAAGANSMRDTIREAAGVVEDSA